MTSDPVVSIFESLDLVLILLAFAVFARLAIKGKNIGGFRFQLSIFLLIWVVSEIPHIAETLGFLATAGYEDTGLYLHATSMALFALFVGWRSLKFLTFKQLPPITGASLPTTRPK